MHPHVPIHVDARVKPADVKYTFRNTAFGLWFTTTEISMKIWQYQDTGKTDKY